jgi:hypothetical protein
MSRARMRRLGLIVLVSISCPVAWSADTQGDVGVSDNKYIVVIRAIARETALAETEDKDAVKFLSLGVNAAGEVVVRRIGLGKDHGTSFPLAPGEEAFAHVHNRQMSPKPEAADFGVLRRLKVPSFVISADGNDIWEVAVVGGKERYRPILPSGVGDWVEFRT